jgi:hypothetical protein
MEKAGKVAARRMLSLEVNKQRELSGDKSLVTIGDDGHC